MEINTSCEPMDIDLSSNSVSDMDISYNDNSFISEKNTTPKVKDNTSENKKTFKRWEVKMIKEQHKPLYQNIYLNIVGFAVVLISACIYHSKVNCVDFDINNMKNNLTSRIFGQETAISQIIETMEDKTDIKFMMLYGGTGVGKTFAVSIILEKIHNYANVYHHTMPSFLDIASSNVLFGLTLCKSSLIVIDDLKISDILLIKDIMKNLVTNAQKLDKNVIIILVFNCDAIDKNFSFRCDQSFEGDLKQKLNDISVPKTVIKFNNLDNHVLRKCIEHEFGKKVDEDLYSKILRNFDVQRDGCKGVHKKMKYLNVI